MYTSKYYFPGLNMNLLNFTEALKHEQTLVGGYKLHDIEISHEKEELLSYKGKLFVVLNLLSTGKMIP